MAEYYPLLAKAVGGLPQSTPDTRRAIYERARKALMGQLRTLQPPIAEEDIQRESQALDAAVVKLETEFAAVDTSAPVEPTLDVPPPPPEASPPPAPPPEAAPAPAPRTPPFPLPRQRSAPPLPARPRIPAPAPPSEAATPVEVAPAPTPPALAELAPATADGDAAQTPPSIEASTPPPPPPPPPPKRAEQRLEPQRPFAPTPPVAVGPPRRLWIVGLVVAAVVALVAGAAWKLRDRPEDIARLKSVQAQSQGDQAGKIVERVGGSPADANRTTNTQTSAQPASGQTAANTPAASDASQPAIPVAQRAALLVEAPDEPGKVKSYVGTAVWRLDNVSNGPGQPLSTAVRADVDIPEDKFQATIIFQKNIDPTLPASHTMKIMFTAQPGSPTGGVKQINVPQMRREGVATGEPLSGIPVPITDNSFLIGLSRGNAEAANIDLISTRAWIDIPMLLTSGRVSKLTFEKGTAGQRAIDDALASWQAQ